MARLRRIVKDHLQQAKDACLNAVENYNRPRAAFRTRTFSVLMTIAWKSLFHAIFYHSGRKPWYVRNGSGRGTGYVKVDRLSLPRFPRHPLRSFPKGSSGFRVERE